MLRYLKTSKSRSDPRESPWHAQGLKEFAIALPLLGLALFMALMSQSAALRGDSTRGIAYSLAALLLAAITAVTIVPRLARKTNLFGWMMRLSFSITRAGGIFIIVVFMLSLAAINTGNNLLFLIVAALLSSIITSGIAARTSLRSVSVCVRVPENVFEGERLSLKVSLRNQKRFFSAFSVTVEDLDLGTSISDGGGLGKQVLGRRHRKPKASETARPILRQAAYFPVVLPGETRSELVSQFFPQRGLYRLEGFRISTRFPFGFFKRTEHARTRGEVLVYPSIHEVSGYFHLLPFLPGRLEGMRVGQGESLYAIRKYQGGDSARLVDWKATAKTGELMSREYARDEESKFCLILDTLVRPPLPDGHNEEFEKAVRLAASLAAHFTEEGAELEFLTPFEYLPRGVGTGQFHRILRSLATVACEPAPPESSPDLRGELSGIVDPQQLQQILSDKLFKIIISSKPRGSFTSTIWRSSHVVYFDEL